MALAELATKFKSVMDEANTIAIKEGFGDSDAKRLEELLAQGETLKGQIEALKRAEGLSAWGNQSAGALGLTGGATVVGTRPAGGADLQVVDNKGVKSILINDEGEMLVPESTFKTLRNPDYVKAFKSYMRHGQHGLKAEELKVLSEGSDTAGGYTVPEEILNRLISREPAPRTVASRVSRLTTSRDALNIPQVVYTTDNQYTSGMRITWTGEVPASATTHRVTEPSFGQVHIPIFTAMMSLPLTNDLIEDSTVGLINWASGKFEETVELLFENMILNGTGAIQPLGILQDSNLSSVNSGAAAALTWDGIHDLIYALPEQYDRNGVVVMNKTNTALALSKLADGDGRPYWSQGSSDYGLVAERFNGSVARPLLGYPVVFNAFMPNVGAGNKSILFGDLSGYYLVTRVGFSIQVLRELYAETNQVLMLGRIRFGGKPVEFWRYRAQNISA